MSTEAEYGTRKTNTTSAETIWSAREPYRAPRNSGIVIASRRAVMSRVRPARSHHAASVPTAVFPATIHIVWIPKPQPSLPA